MMTSYTERERFLMELNADFIELISDFVDAIETDDRKALSSIVKEAADMLVVFGGRDEIQTKVQ
jgi:hypothetical protein